MHALCETSTQQAPSRTTCRNAARVPQTTHTSVIAVLHRPLRTELGLHPKCFSSHHSTSFDLCHQSDMAGQAQPAMWHCPDTCAWTHAQPGPLPKPASIPGAMAHPQQPQGNPQLGIRQPARWHAAQLYCPSTVIPLAVRRWARGPAPANLRLPRSPALGSTAA